MPIYEYRCKSCDSVIEVIQKFSDAPLTQCRNCGGTLERLISPPGLQFKGSGWYITDYARAGKGKNGGGKESSESKSESKAETKPEKSTAKRAKPD